MIEGLPAYVKSRPLCRFCDSAPEMGHVGPLYFPDRADSRG